MNVQKEVKKSVAQGIAEIDLSQIAAANMDHMRELQTALKKVQSFESVRSAPLPPAPPKKMTIAEMKAWIDRYIQSQSSSSSTVSFSLGNMINEVDEVLRKVSLNNLSSSAAN